MKHNNVIPNQHFRKYWQRYVKTWCNQPARKHRRRDARLKKGAEIFPRPINGLVRPIVHCPTAKYSRKLKLGRGFTIEELKAAKIDRRQALTIGISVDPRRRNKSEESLRANVARLQEYKAKLVLFPKKYNTKKLRAGEASKEERSRVQQVRGDVMPIAFESAVGPVQSRAITQADKDASIINVIRKARTDKRLFGPRKKAAEAAAKEEANK